MWFGKGYIIHGDHAASHITAEAIKLKSCKYKKIAVVDVTKRRMCEALTYYGKSYTSKRNVCYAFDVSAMV